MIEIEVQQWSEGAPALRGTQVVGGLVGLFGEVAGSGGYTVVARFYRENDAVPICEQRYEGTITSNEQTASADAGDSVGHSILSDALRADAQCGNLPPIDAHRDSPP